MPDQLQALCEDILDNLEDAAACVLEDDYPDPDESAELLKAHLEETLARIEAALGELGGDQPPVTHPLPATLPEIAQRCRTVARDLFLAEGVLRRSEEDLRAHLVALRGLIGTKPGGFLDLAHVSA